MHTHHAHKATASVVLCMWGQSYPTCSSDILLCLNHHAATHDAFCNDDCNWAPWTMASRFFQATCSRQYKVSHLLHVRCMSVDTVAAQSADNMCCAEHVLPLVALPAHTCSVPCSNTVAIFGLAIASQVPKVWYLDPTGPSLLSAPCYSSDAH